MEEIVSLPPMEFFDNDYQAVLDFIEDLGYPKFKIAGDVNLKFNNKITTLGNLVEVGGSLDLCFTIIESLPDNLKVGGYLDLFHSNILSLPNNLHVDGFLTIKDTSINKLPDNLYVGNNLNAAFLKIHSIPNNLHIGNDLNIFKTPLTIKFYKSDIRQMIIGKGGYIGGTIY